MDKIQKDQAGTKSDQIMMLRFESGQTQGIGSL